MPTSTSKQATTIQERKQFNNTEHKKRILLFRKKSTSKFKKIRVFFSRQWVASRTWDARRRGQKKRGLRERLFLRDSFVFKISCEVGML
jgi:hypothetical protein